MGTTDVIGIVIAVVIVAAFVFVAVRGMQRRRLRERFGDEYERVVEEKGRSAAEAELRRRQRHHSSLELHDLTVAERARYRDGWLAVQARFVDDPVGAVRDGDHLVTDLVSARGYPVADYADRLSQLSVEHARVLGHYRDAHDISLRNDSGTATTEQLRQALVHYRELFADLLGEQPSAPTESNTTRSTTDMDDIDGRLARAADDRLADRATDDDAPTVHATPDDATPPDETTTDTAVGDSVRAGARGSASQADASAPHTDAARRDDTPPHGR